MDNQEFNPPPVQTSSKPKIVYVLIVILVLGLGGIGGYLLGTKKTSVPIPTISPKTTVTYPVATTSDETAGWKTYKDVALGFEFKYPSMVSLKLEKPDNYRLLQLINQKGLGVGSLVYYDNPDSLSLKEFENKLTSEDRSGEHVRVYTPTDEVITTVSGETGFLNKNGMYEPNPSDLYIFPRDKKIFIWIRYQGLTEEYKREDFENQILSTFKFLPQVGSTSSPQASPVTVDETAGRKTYTNTQYNISFKYPIGWFLDMSGDGTILLDSKPIKGGGVFEPGQVAITMDVVTDQKLIDLYSESLPKSFDSKYINSQQFDYFYTSSDGGQPPKQVLFAQTKKDKVLYRVWLTNLSEKDIFDQVLSTFKFL